MAVFPDRIVLKNSTDDEATIIAAIQSGGTDEISAGELVLGRTSGGLEIYSVDSDGNIVGLSGSTSLGTLTDVNLTALANGDLLRYNGSEWVNEASTQYDIAQDGGDFDTGQTDATQTIFDFFPISIDAHSDVDTSTTPPSDGQALVWSNSANNWVPGAGGGGATAIDDLTDVDTSTTPPSNGQVLSWDGANWIPANQTGGGAASIDDLSDVDTTTTPPSSGQVLGWDGAQWEPYSIPAGSLSGLSDTSVTSPVTGDYLRYLTGTGWVDTTLSISDDPAPDLGGDLDVAGHKITSQSGVNIQLQAGVNGGIVFRGNGTNVGRFTLNCELNSHGITIQSPAHSAGATYTLTLPTSAGTSGYVLQTDGSGNTSWVPQGGGAGALDDLSDVTITSAVTGEVLRYNGSQWVDAQLAYSDLSGTPTNLSQFANDAGFIVDISGENLEDLSNVVISGATNGDVLSYNGTNWVNSAAPPADISGSSIGQLNDVDTTTSPPINGEALVWNSTSGNWEPSTVSVVGSIDDLSDVDTTTSAPTTGQVLEWDGANWVPANNSGGGATSIDDLTDVDTSTAAPSLGQVLKWDGSNWIPGNDNTGGGGSATLGRGDGGDLDFGTVDSAFVFAVYGGGDLDTTAEDKPVEFVSYDVDGGELT